MKALPITVLTIVCAVALVSCVALKPADVNAASYLGGNDIAGIIEHPTQVQAWQTLGALNHTGNPQDNYKKAGQPRAVSPSMADRLAGVLLDKRSYFVSSQIKKACAPEFGIVVTFSNQQGDVDVFFCFQCAILRVEATDKEGKPMTGAQRDFDPSLNKIRRIVKKMFNGGVDLT